MTVTVLDRALVAGDAGRVTGEQERPDPEVPERARRRTFTAQYKLDVLAAYDAAGPGLEGHDLASGGPVFQSHRGLAAVPGHRGACQGQRPLGKGMQVIMDDELIMWLTKDLVS